VCYLLTGPCLHHQGCVLLLGCVEGREECLLLVDFYRRTGSCREKDLWQSWAAEIHQIVSIAVIPWAVPSNSMRGQFGTPFSIAVYNRRCHILYISVDCPHLERYFTQVW
jgi:hypothetical protein